MIRIDKSCHSKLVSFASALVLMSGLMGLGCGPSDTAQLDQRKQVAGELRDNKLYSAAIAEYDELLDAEGLSDSERGSVAYLIGKVYFEDLNDYENAAAYYVRARTYDPHGAYMEAVSRNLVAALEKSGKFLDAKRELERVTDINAEDVQRGAVPVAIISGDTVWLIELETQIQTLPPEMQEQMLTPEAKREFLKQYVGMVLIAQSAVREGLDREADFLLRKETLVKKLLMEKYIAEKIMPKMTMEPNDLRDYYEANKDGMYRNQKYEAVAQRVVLDYRTEKSARAYLDHVAKLAKIEQVLFLDQNIK